MLRFLSLILWAGSLVPGPALAWGKLGHELVGALAQERLAPAAQREVAALLAGESEPTLAGVAYWADALRTQDAPRFAATSRWHYVALQPGTCRYDAAACRDDACVVGAIQAQRRLLADAAQPRAARRDALKFLVHLLGDVHQPLHASDRPDKGGNGFQVSLRTSIEPEAYARAQYRDGIMGTNLHAVWDYYVLAGAGRPLETYAAALKPAMPADTATPGEPAQWAEESCRLISAWHLYPDAHVMRHDYLDAMRPLAEQRVALAARRLAQVLNEVLGEAGTRRPAGD